MESLTALMTARQILESVTPLKTDCGRICGGLCCRPDEKGNGGMLLFPEEEKLYTGLDGFEIRTDSSLISGVRLLVCSGRCDRSLRPLACRFFPLRPSLKHTVCIDRRSLSLCPLAEHGLSGLDPVFVEAAAKAARILMESPPQRDFIRTLGRAILQCADRSRL